MIGKNIKKYRRIADFTQQELADKCGLSRVGISDIERGIFNPSVDTIRKIAKALNITIDKIFPA